MLFEDLDNQLCGPTVLEDIGFGPLNLKMDRRALTSSSRSLPHISRARRAYSVT